MRRNVGIALFVVSLVGSGLLSVALGAEGGSDGKSIFLGQKCNVCHSIQAAGIERMTKSSKAPDLSGVGLERDADWIGKFVTKQVDLHGKKHLKLFTGSEADLKTLTAWLAGMKEKKS